MRFYFSSDRPCALKLGGVYLGLTGNAEKFINIDEKEKILCEFIPTNGEFLPITFTIGENISPPNGIKIYIFRNAIAVYAENFIHSDGSMKLIAQKKYSDCTASVFLQSRVQASIENRNDIYVSVLPDCFCKSRIERINDCIVIVSDEALAVMNTEGKLLISTKAKNVQTGETLSAIIPFADSMLHVAECEWECSSSLKTVNYVIKSRLQPKDGLLIYAVTESLLIGAEIKNFVSESLYEKRESLKKFLGNYLSVIYITDEVAGLCYEIKKDVFRVDYYTADLKDGKIDNIRERETET